MVINTSTFQNNVASLFQPTDGGSAGLGGSIVKWFGDTTSTKALNTGVQQIIQGDVVGGALAAIKGLGGILTGANHREKVVTGNIKNDFGTFEASAKDLPAVNSLYKTVMGRYANESKQEGKFEQYYLDALKPIEQQLISQGFKNTLANGVTDRNIPFTYPVWSAPVGFADVKNVLGGAAKSVTGMGALLVAGLGFGAYKLFSKK